MKECRRIDSLTLMLFIDKKSSIEVSKNPEYHGCIKHLDLQHYWLRDAVQDLLITPVYVPACQNVADLFTTTLSVRGDLHSPVIIGVLS